MLACILVPGILTHPARRRGLTGWPAQRPAMVRLISGTWPGSEIRLVRLRNRLEGVVEKILGILRARFFGERTKVHAAIALDPRPDHVEGARVLDSHHRLERFAP